MSDAGSKDSQADSSEQETLDYYSVLRSKKEDRWKQAVAAAEKTVSTLTPGVYANYGSVILAISREGSVDRALAKRALDDLQGRGLARYQFGMGVSNTGNWPQAAEGKSAGKIPTAAGDGVDSEEKPTSDSGWSSQGVLYASRPLGDRLRVISPSRDHMGHGGAVRSISLIGDLPSFEGISEGSRSDYLMDHLIGSTRLGSLVDLVLDLQDRAKELDIPLDLVLDLTDDETPLVIHGGIEELISELSTFDENGRSPFASRVIHRGLEELLSKQTKIDDNGRASFVNRLSSGRIDYGTAVSVHYALLAKTPPRIELDGNQLLAFLDEKSSTPFRDVVLEAEADVYRELAARIRSGAFQKS